MPLLPVRSLFWRAFLTFWSAMALILVCGMLFTAAVAWYRVNSLDGLNPGSLAHDAAQIAREDGTDGLERWVAAMDARYSALNIYLVDASDHDILGRALPARLRDWLKDYRAAPPDPFPAASAPSPSVRVSWWDPQLLTLPDGRELLMLFLPFDSSHWELLGLAPVALVIVLFALAVTAPLCWALTRNVTAPLDALRLATQALSAGQLDARTPARLTRRKDELGLLAQDFDAMASRLQALVGTREQLLRTIAHELRSPLARLQLAVELARRKDERLDLQLDRIEREGERLDALVGNTLALAKMGALPEPADMLDLAEVVDAVVEDARFEAGDRNVGIAWERPAPLRIQGDLESLASAIENVLRNALRFAPTGSSIRLRLLAGLRDVQLEIEDRGPGVPEQELGYLFEPFYRSASGAAMAGSGAGLGLSIARAAVAAHKGRISASNVLPQGLSVRIELPLAAT